MTMSRTLAASLALAALSQAHALEVKDCDGSADSLRNIVEPWDKYSREFHSGKVRITYTDTGGEPACCSGWLVVTYPSAEPPEGYDECKLIGGGDGLGLLAIGFESLKASYDAKTGLTVRFPYTRYVDGLNDKAMTGKFTIDLKAGRVTVGK